MNVVACVLLPFSLPPFTACACSLFEAPRTTVAQRWRTRMFDGGGAQAGGVFPALHRLCSLVVGGVWGAKQVSGRGAGEGEREWGGGRERVE